MLLHLKRMLFLSLLFIFITGSLNCAKEEEKDVQKGGDSPGESGGGDSSAEDESNSAMSSSDSIDVICTEEGEVFFAKKIGEKCCNGLRSVSSMDVPDPDDKYPSDVYPEGCGPGPFPPDLMICVACADAVCGLKEHFCNCPKDCRFGEIGPTE